MRLVLVLLAASALAGATATPGGAADECHGLTACIPVPGPWVLVRKGAESDFLLSCGKRGVVGGVDADATTAAVRLSFDGRLGAPVSPGVTTTQSAYFRGVLVRGRRGAFRPWLGCVPASGGGGRSTVSARAAPGAALVRHARIVVVTPGEVKSASIGCPAPEKLVGGWHAIAFRDRKAPDLRDAALVEASHVVTRTKVVVTVAATDALSVDSHAIVQVGAACAP